MREKSFTSEIKMNYHMFSKIYRKIQATVDSFRDEQSKHKTHLPKTLGKRGGSL